MNTARSEIAPYHVGTPFRAVFRVGRALRARRCREDVPYFEMLVAGSARLTTPASRCIFAGS